MKEYATIRIPMDKYIELIKNKYIDDYRLISVRLNYPWHKDTKWNEINQNIRDLTPAKLRKAWEEKKIYESKISENERLIKRTPKTEIRGNSGKLV